MNTALPSATMTISDRDRLLSLLRAGQYSQRGAARELGVSERTMRYWCSGTREIPRYILLALAHLVECPH